MHTKAQNLNNIILIFEKNSGAKTRVLHSGAGALYTAFKSSSHLQFIAFFHRFQFAERFQISSNNLSESNFLLPKIILNEGSSDCTKLQTKKKILETLRPCG